MNPSLYIPLGILALLGYILLFMFPLNKGAPYVPSNSRKISLLLKILDEKYGLSKFQKAVDLGSGDGRILVALAKIGITCYGIEQNKILVKKSISKITKLNLQNKCKVYNKDFFKFDISEFDLIILWQVPHIMGKIEKKIKDELKPGTVVCSYYYKIPEIKEKILYEGWYIYQI